MRVDFIGIGVQKAATSWLHDVLALHPDVDASDPKELDFFTAHYDRGYGWYESHFAEDPRHTRGECSPSYFYSRSAPLRAHVYNPDFRVIAILRDPVARAFSNHLHELRKGHIPDGTSFEDGLAANPAYVEQGKYAANLTRWLDTFGRDALLVLLAEDIGAEPLRAYKAVCDHLSLAADPVPDALYERRHESVAPKHAGLQRALRVSGDAARAIGLDRQVANVKALPGVRNILRMNQRDLRAETPNMRPETKADLAETFAEDIAFVSALLDRAELPWPSQQAEVARAGNA